MPKLQCPKCKNPIQLAAIPADNRIQCGSCKAEFTIKPPATAKPLATSASGAGAAKPVQATAANKPAGTARPSSQKVDPNDPFSSIDLNTLGKGNRVDFGVAPVPSGVMESPQGGAAPWLAGNSAAYVPLTEAEAAALTEAASKPGSKPISSIPGPQVARKSNLGVTIAVASVLVLMAGGAIVAAVLVGRAGSASAKAVAERPKIKVPEGFEIVKQMGVEHIMPISEKASKSPVGFAGKIGRSSKTQSYYLFIVSDQLSGEITPEKVAKVTRNMVNGDILGASEFTHGNYKGFRGSHATGIFLPERMTIEMFPIEDRFIVRGYIPYSSTLDGYDPDRQIDTEAETAELNMFKESMFVGKKPGFFGS